MEKRTMYKKNGIAVEIEHVFTGSKSLKELVLEYMQKEQETADRKSRKEP